jgi:hypothetical protein
MFLDLLTFFNYLCHEDSVSITAIRKKKVAVAGFKVLSRIV